MSTTHRPVTTSIDRHTIDAAMRRGRDARAAAIRTMIRNLFVQRRWGAVDGVKTDSGVRRLDQHLARTKKAATVSGCGEPVNKAA